MNPRHLGALALPHSAPDSRILLAEWRWARPCAATMPRTDAARRRRREARTDGAGPQRRRAVHPETIIDAIRTRTVHGPEERSDGPAGDRADDRCRRVPFGVIRNTMAGH